MNKLNDRQKGILMIMLVVIFLYPPTRAAMIFLILLYLAIKWSGEIFVIIGILLKEAIFPSKESQNK